MAALSGKAGTLNGSGTDIASWTLNYVEDQLDSSHMGGGGYREFTAGLISGTLTLVTNSKTTASGTVTLTDGTNSYAGTIAANSTAWEVPVDGLVKWTRNYNFSGSITVT